MLTPTTRQLVELMAQSPRGPRRDGLFALWLTVRVVEDLDQQQPFSERATRRRVALLERRLSSLTLPPALRRGLNATIQAMKAEAVPKVSMLLRHLVGPAKESLGAEAGEALQLAARTHQ